VGSLARQLGDGVVILELSYSSSNAMLDALAREMDGGSIELLGSTGQVLATLYLSDPAALKATGGQLTLGNIAEDIAPSSGLATSGRVIGANGGEVLACDVGDAESDAMIKLTPQLITRGAPVRIDSFKLQMP
jgi:hypothetical protein